MERYLILKDGTVFTGEAIGASGETVGEAVFTTAMCGYMQTLTDPSYYGQIVAQTFPLIGNYGAIEDDAESAKPYLAGYVVRELCDHGSNFRKDGELDDYLKRNGIVGIAGIDVRALTRRLRSSGVMGAMITESLKEMPRKLAEIKKFRVTNAVENTTCDKITQINPVDAEHPFKVVLYDFGAKYNIERMLMSHGCSVTRVPASTTAEQALALAPDGIMLSNGGGDPADNTAVIAELKKLCASKLPIFGICLGHQLLALANGFQTVKLKYGHRGANQPVTEASSGRTYITSQNHGYAVRPSSVDTSVATLMFSNANDRTVEGLEYKNAPMFSVQFHPEACGGPKDTGYLFDRFIGSMRAAKGGN